MRAIHPAMLADEDLLKECEIRFGRAGGPGGQHRNKVETAVNILHKPTQVFAKATERRKQFDNRRMAIRRLREKLARAVRRQVDRNRYTPSSLWQQRRQGERIAVNPDHRDYPGLLAEALDVIVARDFDVAGAAGLLGVTMSQLARLVRHDKAAFALVNDGRVKQGLPPLK